MPVVEQPWDQDNMVRRVDPSLFDLQSRVGRIEIEIKELISAGSADRAELAVMKTDIRYIKEAQDAVRSGVNRIFWSIALSVIAAATTFVLSGGLVIVQ